VYRVVLQQEFVGGAIDKKNRVLSHWRKAIVALAVIILLIIGATGYIWNNYFRLPPVAPVSIEKMAYPLPDKPTIAVLPFVNMSGDPEQEYFGDGITEDLITDLSKISGLFIIARNSTLIPAGFGTL